MEIGRWRPVLVHSSRTAVAAVASVLAARLFHLPETYWAPITTLVITQSSLGTALAVSGERFVGTMLGAAVGAIVASYFGPHMLVFGLSLFILGVLCAATHSDRSAYRFAGVTQALAKAHREFQHSPVFIEMNDVSHALKHGHTTSATPDVLFDCVRQSWFNVLSEAVRQRDPYLRAIHFHELFSPTIRSLPTYIKHQRLLSSRQVPHRLIVNLP